MSCGFLVLSQRTRMSGAPGAAVTLVYLPFRTYSGRTISMSSISHRRIQPWSPPHRYPRMGCSLMPDETPTPEFLPPEPTGVIPFLRTAKQKRAAKIVLSATVLFAGLLFAIQEFFQGRGMGILTTRVFLVIAWVCAVMLVFGALRVFEFGRWLLIGSVVSLVLAVVAFVMDGVYPMPESASVPSIASRPGDSQPLQPLEPLQSLTVSPIKLVFKDEPIGKTSSSQIITVINRANAPRIITGIKISGSFSQTNDCASELMIGDSCNVEVTFTPTTLGLTHGGLEISCEDPLFSSVNLTATVDFSGSGNARSGSMPRQPEQPDLVAEFADKNDVHMIISNVHGVTAHTPKFMTVLVDVDDGADIANGKFHKLLPLPGQTDDYLMGHSSFLMLPLLHYQVPNALPSNHRAFGFIALSCADCQQIRRYWLYFQSGTGGWYSEFRGQPERTDMAMVSHLNPQDLSSLNQIVSPSKRRAIIASDDVVVKYQQQGTFR